MASDRSASPLSLKLLRDDRVLQIVGQIVFALVIIISVYGLVTGIFAALESRNLTPNFSFLQLRAGFDISEKPTWYSADSTYWQAYTVGVMNTVRVVVMGLIISTVLGVLVGIFLLSTNWLVRTISNVYVELLRNIPLLLVLLAVYFVGMFGLPTFQQSASIPSEGLMIIPIRWFLYAAGVIALWVSLQRLPPYRHSWRRILIWGGLALIVAIELAVRIGLFSNGGALRIALHPWLYMNIRGFALPEIRLTGRTTEWLIFVAGGVIAAVGLWVYFGRVKEKTGIPAPRFLIAVSVILVAAVIGWAVASAPPAVFPSTDANGQTVEVPLDEALTQGLVAEPEASQYQSAPLVIVLPEKSNFRYTAGTLVTPELMALLIGLSLYTSAFIAEIVRAGILAVPKGQIEAARALGLKTNEVLWLVILPQALRVIIPPLGNQYLNLAKNSSLAIPIAFADLFLVATTIMNQSGQSVTTMTMMMLTYLAMSLIIAGAMSLANRRFQLVTR
ncbi:MAG: ABC transporter permease subunit [Anaerolineae bacterium]